jgi:solute carrier family 9B (sodium/hydrogen exchanger), member 1/2
VVVPSLLTLKERGFGEDKGISTLVIAASSLDDIAAISLFGIFLGMIFADKSNKLNAIKAILNLTNVQKLLWQWR